MSATDRLRFADLLAPLGAGLVVRALFVWSFAGSAGLGDESAYVNLGRSWSEAGAYGGIWAPLHAGLLGALHALFGDGAPNALRVLHLGLAAWVGGCIAWIANGAGGRRAAIVAAWIHALYLPLAGFCGLLLSEVVFLALFAPALGLLLHAARAGRASVSPWTIPLAGALAGVATLTRESTILFLPVLALWIALAVPVARGGRSARPAEALAIAPAASFALAAALVIAPWTARNAHVYRHLVPVATSTGGSSFIGMNAYDINFDLAGLGASATEPPGELRRRIRGEAPAPWSAGQHANVAERAQHNVRAAVAFAAEHPAFFARSRVVEFVDLVTPLSFPVRALRLGDVGAPLRSAGLRRTASIAAVVSVPALMILALLGWATARDVRAMRSLAAAVALTTCAFALVNGLSRYRVPALPLVIVLAALFLSGSRESAPARRRLAAGAVAALLALAWIPSLEPTRLALEALWD